MYTIIATKKKQGKRPYYLPCIERVILDYEISLTLDSLNGRSPGGEPNNWSKVPQHGNYDPFKTSLG